uniref:Uncharacterized protein n=1 Tax=Coccidioides posadasii RMSCC 3488 TaxID=454284 RepID=A0A0J6IH33_COCPO|nr:hypothetical protein CPAG_07429 [Coccidioides posadasii RMSCC 3488]
MLISKEIAAKSAGGQGLSHCGLALGAESPCGTWIPQLACKAGLPPRPLGYSKGLRTGYWSVRGLSETESNAAITDWNSLFRDLPTVPDEAIVASCIWHDNFHVNNVFELVIRYFVPAASIS